MTKKVEAVLYLHKALKESLKIQKCETHFRTFVEEAWKVVEPGVPFVGGWHIDAICEHLQAVSNRQIRQLIINMPPRHMKSSLVAVLWPVWRWIAYPEEQWLFSSYAESLSIRDSRKCRNLIKSPWFQRNWGQKFKIVSDQDEKKRFDNDHKGYRLATSVGGSNTGEGGSVQVMDDPNSMSEIHSPVVRQSVIDWYDQTMVTRLNDPRTGCRVCVQQRGHENDMTGHLLELGNWETLILPARYEGTQKVTSIGWVDPRTIPGQLLWPERFDDLHLVDLERTMGPTTAAGQLQQRPSPAGGSIFERQWFEYYNPRGVETKPVLVKNPGQDVISKTPVELPLAFEQILQSWDLTFKDLKTNDYVAGHVWGRVGANFYLLDRVHGRLDFTKTLQAIKKMSREHPCPEKLVEDKANGPAVINTLKNEIPGLIPINPEGGKESRANAVSPYVESGNVYLPNPQLHPWVLSFIEECANFPRGKHDDDVDAMTQALRRLADSIAQSAFPEFRVVPRANEPTSATHVEAAEVLQTSLPPHWRRWISISPGAQGAALWFCETSKGSLRVYRELDLSGIDAHETGRQIAEATLPDIRAYKSTLHSSAKWSIDLLMEREAFTAVEPIGCYAELLEDGISSYEPTDGSWDYRQTVKNELRTAKFTSQMTEIEDAAYDRLRDLMKFKPADFEVIPYSRKKAFELAYSNIQAYTEYIAATEGQVVGEWPKIKFSASCPTAIAVIGTSKRDQEIDNPFLRAVMLGISAPESVQSAKPSRLLELTPRLAHKLSRSRNQMRRAG